LTVVLVRDLREHRVPASADEPAGSGTGVLAGSVLALIRDLARSFVRAASIPGP
jgi:hypothetical protein